MRTVHKNIQLLKVKVEDMTDIAAIYKSNNQVICLAFKKPKFCAFFLSQNQGIKPTRLENRGISILIKESNAGEEFLDCLTLSTT